MHVNASLSALKPVLLHTGFEKGVKTFTLQLLESVDLGEIIH
jgi:hypothetical protein